MISKVDGLHMMALLALSAAVLGVAACGDDDGDDGNGDDTGGDEQPDAGTGDGDGDGDAPPDSGDGSDDPPSLTGRGDADAVDTSGDDGSWVMLAGGLASHYHNRVETTLTTDNAGSLEEAWTLTTQGAPTGTAVYVDGVVYIPAGGQTYALGADSGDILWQIGEAVQSSLAYSDGLIYLHNSGSEVVAVDAESGDEVWRSPSHDNGAAIGYSSPVVAKDLVIVGTSSSEEVTGFGGATFRGRVVAFDKATGDEVWDYYTVEPPDTGATIWSTVSVDLALNNVYVSTGNNYQGNDSGTSDAIIALDLDTGEQVWVTQVTSGDLWTAFSPVSDDTDFGANPILFDAEIDGETRQLLGCGQKSGIFWVLDRVNGDIVYSKELSGGRAMTGGVLNNGAYDGERLLIATNTGVSEGDDAEADRGVSRTAPYADGSKTSLLAALDPATGDILWERQIGAWVWAPITVANGVGFVSSETRIEAFDVETGAQLFTFEGQGTITSSAVVNDGRVFFGSGMTYLTGTAGTTFYSLALP